MNKLSASAEIELPYRMQRCHIVGRGMSSKQSVPNTHNVGAFWTLAARRPELIRKGEGGRRKREAYRFPFFLRGRERERVRADQ